jgi:hypothetical protein
MKEMKKNKTNNSLVVVQHQPTAFELLMNYQAEMRSQLGLEPLPHWVQKRPTPDWAKNIFRNFSKTVLKPILRLRPKKRCTWRQFGKIVGVLKRLKTFLDFDVNAILRRERLDRISAKKWAKIKPIMGEDLARDFHLKLLKFPANSIITTERLAEMAFHKQSVYLDRMIQDANKQMSLQDAKANQLFIQGMREGYTAFLNADGEFSAEDRRADIHLELLAWQHDIEKMRRSLPQKYNKHLTAELQKLPKYKTKGHDWFAEVFKDIKLSIGPRGRPRGYCEA